MPRSQRRNCDDGRGGDGRWDAGAQGDDAGDVGGFGGLGDAAKDDFVDERRVEAGAREQRIDCNAAEFVGRERGEVGAGSAEGRAETVDDDETGWGHN